MSTVGGDGEVEPTQILAEGDLEEVDRSGERRPPSEEPVEHTAVMDDSQLRELVGSPGRTSEASREQEAAARAKREAEKAAREREEALARVRAHRRQSADTRGLRPANAVPPEESRVSLSRDALDMLEREIEPSSPPPAPVAKPAPMPPAAHSGSTTRPPRPTAQARPRPQVPPPGRVPETPPPRAEPPSPDRTQALLRALAEVEKRLLANDVPGALEVVARAKRGH